LFPIAHSVLLSHTGVSAGPVSLIVRQEEGDA